MAKIHNEVSNTLVSGTSKADTIVNEFSYGSSRRFPSNNVTIKALAGNDKISNEGGNNVVIYGGAGNDSIALDSSSATNNVIKYAEGDGNDTVVGFNADDTLHITKGKFSTVVSGNDFIVNVGTGKIILKNALADKSNLIKIKNSSGKVVTYNNWKVWNGSITGNIKSNVTLAGSKNADTIGNRAKNVLITGQAGNDDISNSGDNVTMKGGAGNDTIYNGGSNVTINADAGNDSISNDGDFKFSDVLMNGGSGKDTIYIEGGGNWTDVSPNIKNVTIDGGANDDVITLYDFGGGGHISINGGAGNDSISNDFDDSTITGGKGDDYISLDSDYAKNNVIQYAEGDGNDTIIGFNSDDTLQITSGSYETAKSGTDFVVTVGDSSILLKDVLVGGYEKIKIADSSGSVTTYNDWKVWNGSITEYNVYDHVTLAGSENADTIRNHAKNVLITGQAGNDSISNYYGDSYVTIDGGAGNDSIDNGSDSNYVAIDGGEGDDKIYNHGSDVTIEGGAGNDSISNNYYGDSYVTIDGGAGDDTIRNSFSNDVSLFGGAGNDKIHNSGDKVTITGGAGNDFISLYSYAKNNLIQYAAGDGNDTIRGFNSDDTLNITEGSYTTAKSGKDFIVTVGENSILLKNAFAKGYEKIKIKNSSGKVVTYNNWKVWNGSIENNVYSNVTLAGSKKSDTIGNSAWNVSITGGKGNDLITLGSDASYNLIQYAAGDGNDTIFGFNADDTLKITSGSYQTSVSGSDVIVTVGTGKITLKDVIGSIKNSSANIAELFEDNNFATAGNISDITDIKIVGEFENYTEKISAENLITFAK